MNNLNIFNVTPEQERAFREDKQKEAKLAEVAGATLPYAAYTLIGINAMVFLLMVISGVSLTEPKVDDLLRWGADFGPLTSNGQWWRLVTAMFLHIGVFHLAINMVVLANIGTVTERLFGRLPFIVLYMLAGIGGSIVSLLWHPLTVSAGASGAIFGLYGGMLALLVRQRREFPSDSVKSLAGGAAVFVGYNLIYGMGKTGIDLGAHIGGLAAGCVLGLALARPLSQVQTGSAWRRSVVVAAGGIALTTVFIVFTKPMDDLGLERARLAATQSKVSEIYRSSVEKWKAKQISNEDLAQIIETQVVPPWNAERTALKSLTRLPAGQKRTAQVLIDFIEARGDSWSFMAQGLRKGDATLMTKAAEKALEANELLSHLDDPAAESDRQ